MRPLLGRQKQAIEKLSRLKVGALFMRPGTGKTQTAVELVKSVNSDYVLWLAPFQTIREENIQAELEACGGLDCELHGIESLSNSDHLYLKLHADLKAARNPFIVCDESLKIKNLTAKRTNRILSLSRLVEYKLVLNGTPLSRNIMDLWSQMEFLSPKILKMRPAEFKNSFCEYVTITKYLGRRSSYREFITGYRNIEYLHSLIGPFVYEAELDLKIGQSHINQYYQVEDELKNNYREIKNRYLESDIDTGFSFIKMVQALQHSYACAAEKFDYVDMLIKEYGKENIVVFCKFLSGADVLQSKFSGLKVLTYGKHSLGLNLQRYNVTVFFDKTWDYYQIDQAERRTYREGQIRDCLYVDLTGDVKLEDLIDRNIGKKIRMVDYFKRKTKKDLEKEL